MLRDYTLYAFAASCRVGLQNWTCFWCQGGPSKLPVLPKVNVTTVFESDGIYGTYGYIGTKQNQILISFRGSESVENWISDFKFNLVPYLGAPAGVKVHDGFYAAYQTVQETVRSTVRALLKQNPSFTVSVTGHSLGGALSIFCTMDLVAQRIVPSNRISVINFGQPRVGNQAFANYFNSQNVPVARVTNQRDVVPHVPMKFLGYYHERTEYWFPANVTTFVVCDRSGEDPACSDSVLDISPVDHLTYLGFYTPDGNAHNCGHVPFDKKEEKKKKEAMYNLVDIVSATKNII